MEYRKLGTVATLCTTLLVPGLAGAHGTDSPGPHGGEVRMPGAFHVEAVPSGDALSLYLLDVRIENPTASDSWVRPVLHQQGEAIELSCHVNEKGFRCPLPEGATLDSGRLVVSAKRADVPHAEVSYELPLTPGRTGDGTG